MTELIIIGLAFALFYAMIRVTIRGWFNGFNDSTKGANFDKNYHKSIRVHNKNKARKDAIVDMSEEGMNTMLLQHDNFFKETYW